MDDLGTVLRRDNMDDALSVVYEVAETGDGTVEWCDVSQRLDQERWGELLRTGVLMEAGDRFVIDDPVAVESYLDDEGELPAATDIAAGVATSSDAIESEPETADSGGWSHADKFAGVGAVTLMLGYQVTEIRDFVGPMVDLLLTPIQAVLPFYLVILLLATGTGVVPMVFQSRMMDYDRMQAQQTRVDEVQERLKAAKEHDNEEAVERIQEEQMELMTGQLGSFTQMLRPLAWTMLFTAPVLLWFYWLMLSPTQAITSTGLVFPVLGRVAWTARVIGPMQAWLLWYSICSLTSRQLIQKTFDVQTGPSTDS